MIIRWSSPREGHLAVIDNEFPGHIREAEYALTVRDIARMHVERMSPNVATCDEKEK